LRQPIPPSGCSETEPVVAGPALHKNDAMSTDTFLSQHPATGEEIGRFPITSPEEVQRIVADAGPAAIWWESLGWRKRELRLLAWNAILTKRIDEVALLISKEVMHGWRQRSQLSTYLGRPNMLRDFCAAT
jgi:acyl-CoA reductase-like NAD-dependent aldehyde dehydrogenase